MRITRLILICFIVTSISVPNCKNHNSVCKVCNDGFILVEFNRYKVECMNKTEYNALQKIPGCLRIDEDDQKCYECKRDFLLDNEKKHCLEKPHCYSLSYNSDKCYSCYSPFSFDEDDSSCGEIPLCQKIKNGKCDYCNEYYCPDDTGNCVRIPIEHCKKGNSTLCVECEFDYFLYKGKCVPEPENCVDINEELNRCDECENYYYLEDGKCYPFPDYCSSYNVST